jgi:hypothetical protein
MHYLPLLLATTIPTVIEEVLYQEKVLTAQEHYEKALAELKNSRARSLVHFLNALEKGVETRVASEKEQKKYLEFVEKYISQFGQEGSQEILDKLQTAQSPAEHLFISTAYLNKEEYGPFFEHFYLAYPYFKDSYLSFRAQGILWVRLASMVSTQEQKQYYLERGIDLLQRSLQVCSKDCSVFEMLVEIAKNEENDLLLISTLETLVESKNRIPRRCIYLFVREAIRLERVEIAQKIIDRAKELYEYCKTTTAAELYLKQYQSGETADATRVSR